MCGICGILFKDRSRAVDEAVLLRMRDSLFHRGPDDAGIYLDGHIGLGARRLSILDLSMNGHMPMGTADGRYWIVYNGEVYNFAELRTELSAKGIRFCSNSDTEVLLYLYQFYGPAMLDRCNGMFAIAIWDRTEETIFLARDRFGVKPLFYMWSPEGLYFASEEKAFFQAGFSPFLDEDTLSELLLFRCVAGEKTLYRGIQRMLPGYYLFYRHGELQIKEWYHLADKINPNSGPKNWPTALEQFKEIFENSIELRRISDVPIGSLLSGGLDSGSMTATMARQIGSGLSTFTVRFSEQDYDEGAFAQELAERWHLDYHELYMPLEDLPEMVRQATYFLDVPLMHGHDPHLLAISRMAKPKVTVLFSGEGADEIMAGYVRYLLFRYPPWVLHSVGIASHLTKGIVTLSSRLQKAVKISSFKSSTEQLVYSSAELLPDQFEGLVKPNLEYRYRIAEESQKIYNEPIRQVMYYEQHTYLQSLLDRNDRMTMGSSIECREPFLDFRLVEWMANLPTHLLYEKGVGKAVLRRSMADWLPDSILKHQKWGFGVPWRTYLRQHPLFVSKLQTLAEGKLQTPLVVDAKVKAATQAFLAGNDEFLPLVRQYIFFDVWQNVCFKGQSE